MAKKANIDLKLAYIYTVRSAVKAKAKAKKALAGPKVKKAVARRKAAIVVRQKAALMAPRNQPLSNTLENVLLQSIFNAGLGLARQLLTKIEGDAARYMV